MIWHESSAAELFVAFALVVAAEKAGVFGGAVE
jgi:hypothetical protein